jgi:hypothetical protein
MTKEKNIKEETNKVKDKRLFPVFYTSELKYFNLNEDARPLEVATVIREKFEMPIRTKQTKTSELKKKLGLSKDATQKEINEAILKKLK